MIETGQIVENFQGRFAKVIKVTEDGMTHLTAWHHKENYAEDDTVVVTRLNEFGLSQVLKGGENTPGATADASTEEAPKATSKKSVKKAE